MLPPEPLAQLRTIEAQVRHAATVYETWGLGARRTGGTGCAALFAGPSGTGKTMAAGVLARALGLDLYRIDLSAVVSKYIGETEKNLARVFEEARATGAVLFFDEADALFGKRSEVKDAHDRYANIEVGFLLQQMEAYDGVAVLASNLAQNLDDAFRRRLQAIVTFPMPGPAERARIWRGLFPPTVPLADDLDLDFLAERFELAGGHLSNAALAAAFLAAEAGRPVSMADGVRGVAREMGKLGRPLTSSQFGEHFAVARREVAA